MADFYSLSPKFTCLIGTWSFNFTCVFYSVQFFLLMLMEKATFCFQSTSMVPSSLSMNCDYFLWLVILIFAIVWIIVYINHEVCDCSHYSFAGPHSAGRETNKWDCEQVEQDQSRKASWPEGLVCQFLIPLIVLSISYLYLSWNHLFTILVKMWIIYKNEKFAHIFCFHINWSVNLSKLHSVCSIL